MITSMAENPNFVAGEQWTSFETTYHEFTVFKLSGKKPNSKLEVFWGKERIRMREANSTRIADYLIALVRGS